MDWGRLMFVSVAAAYRHGDSGKSDAMEMKCSSRTQEEPGELKENICESMPASDRLAKVL